MEYAGKKTLFALGWQPFFESQLDSERPGSSVPARVIAHYGSRVALMQLSDTGQLTEQIVPVSLLTSAKGGGRIQLAVGDWLMVDRETSRATMQLERKTSLSRKAAGEKSVEQLIAANVDTFFIVCSCNQDFNLSRLERYLALVAESGANSVVVLTKADLCEDANQLRRETERLVPGLLVETIDARDHEQARILEAWCRSGQTVALLGSSGVGKSTLANALGGHDILTAGIREDDAKGRHTTTARSMHPLKAGGWLIDNPGMREIQLTACAEGIVEVFDDVIKLTDHCQFRNCTHRGDAGCALEAAVSAGELEERRLASFLKLLAEQARNSASLAERRESERQFGKMYKRIIGDKQKLRES